MRISARLLDARWLLVLLLVITPILGCGKGSQENQQGEDNSATSKSENNTEGTAETTPPPSNPVDDQKRPRVKVETSLGNIVLQLDAEKAPLTVNNFLQYVNEGFYKDTLFHDVSPDYVIIGGTYAEDLTPKPTRGTIYNEARNGPKNVRGTIAMARNPSAIDTATSAFFINVVDNPDLDHNGEEPEKYGYCVFGKVIEGMDVVDRIGKVKTQETTAKDDSSLAQFPVEPVVIRSMRLIQ